MAQTLGASVRQNRPPLGHSMDDMDEFLQQQSWWQGFIDVAIVSVNIIRSLLASNHPRPSWVACPCAPLPTPRAAARPCPHLLGGGGGGLLLAELRGWWVVQIKNLPAILFCIWPFKTCALKRLFLLAAFGPFEVESAPCYKLAAP